MTATSNAIARNPARGSLQTADWPAGARQQLMRWPLAYAESELNTMIDARFAYGLELGPRPQWRAWQQRRFTDLIQWAGRSIWWQHWLGVLGGRPLRDLPIMLRKDMVRALANAGDDTGAPPEHGPCGRVTTLGSTAAPLQPWFSDMGMRLTQAQYSADHLRQGRKRVTATAQGPLTMRMGVIGAQVEASALGTNAEHESLAANPLQGTPEILLRAESPYSGADHAQWLARNPIDYLAVTPAVWSLILDELEAGRARLPRPMLQILTYGDNVGADLRERTRTATGASIKDRYTVEETGPIAFQCPSSDVYMHVAVGNVIVETVRDNDKPAPEGEVGRVVVTGLNQLASPTIRYDVGDRAALHNRCPGCRTDVPALSRLIGRPRFALRMPSSSAQGAPAKHVSVRLAASLWQGCATIADHRLLQIAPTTVRVEIVAAAPLDSAQTAAIAAMLQNAIGGELQYEIVQLDAIDWPPGPMRHPVECLLV